jgi:adenylate kinase family enzyme
LNSSNRSVRRVAVIGTSGSGKTTVARRLAERLGVTHVELDALFWGPGWMPTPPDSDGWVVDGNYGGKLGDLVLQRAELVIWLDPPFRTIAPRLVRRTVSRIRAGSELWSRNRETWRNAFFSRDSLLLYALRTHYRRRSRWPARLARFDHVRLRSVREVEEWLARRA